MQFVSVYIYRGENTLHAAFIVHFLRLLHDRPWYSEGVQDNVEVSYHRNPTSLLHVATVWNPAVVSHRRDCTKCE